jgi:hypothetical protein
MPKSRVVVTERQVRRMEQLVKDRKLAFATGAPPIARRAGRLQRRSREGLASSRIKTVQSYLQLYG